MSAGDADVRNSIKVWYRLKSRKAAVVLGLTET